MQPGDEDAAAGAGFLLKSFHDLLAGLVGEALTLQLLGAPPTLRSARDETHEDDHDQPTVDRRARVGKTPAR
jgi:hypothetical protein